METYGVSLDGFQPSCGWAMYKRVKEELIPQLEREVERWRARRDAAEGERTALKGLKPDGDGLIKSRAGLVAKLQATVSGGGTKVDDVMPLGVKEAEVETDVTWPELSSWLTDAANPLGQISFFYKNACERADCKLALYQNCFESTETDIRFWTRTLELQHAYWVFEKVELKYKTKVCRELVKALADYICDCREQLGRFDDEESRMSALYEDIEWLLKEAEADLAYYRQIKADIAEVGVVEALRLSSRKVTQPTTDIDNGGALNQS